MRSGRLVTTLLVSLSTVPVAATALADTATAPDGSKPTLEVGHSQQRPSGNRVRLGTTVGLKVLFNRARPRTMISGIRLLLPSGMRLNRTGFPACRPARLEQPGPKSCPKGSAVGKGQFTATRSTGAQPERVGGAITAFNGKDRTLLLYWKPDVGRPFVTRFSVTKGGRLLTYRYRSVLLLNAPELRGGPLDSLALTLGRTLKGKRHFLSNPRTCNAGYLWQVELTYEGLPFEGAKVPLQDLAPCRG
jgi:hypothetical protein